MKFANLWMLMALLGGLMVFSGCDNDPEPENEEELITTVRLTFAKVNAGGAPVVVTWQDLDGPGGNPPVLSGPIVLDANSAYTLRVAVLNELENPVEDVTLEVEEEGDEHQFFFLISADLNLTITYDDVDDDGRPIGIFNQVTTGDASTGNLTVVLRHELDKAAAGVAAGNITNAGGETDVETQPPFQVTIQ